MSRATDLLRELPSMDRLLGHERGRRLLAEFQRDHVTRLSRDVLAELRSAIRHDQPVAPDDLTDDAILARIEAGLQAARARPGSGA